MTPRRSKARGPFTAHKTIDDAFVNGPDNFWQTTATIGGAQRIAELLNHIHALVNESAGDISRNPHIDAGRVVAAAAARSLGWRLELPEDRKARMDIDAALASKRSAA